MFFRTLLMVALLAVAARGLSQPSPAPVDVPFDNVHVADQVKLKEALAAIKKGDALAAKGGVDHAAAMAEYGKAFSINPDNAALNGKMGLCLLNGPEPATALAHLQRAAQLDPYMPRVHYLLGYALQLNAKWNEAVAEYQRHAEILRRTPDPDRTYNMAEKRIQECNQGMAYMKAPATATVANLGPSVNSPAGEYGPLLDNLGNLYFTSRRPQTTGGKLNKVNNTWFEDIYHSQWGANGWSRPQPAAGGLNSLHNDATVSISADGMRMILYRDERNGGDLYTSDRNGSAWSVPAPFPATVNSTSQESSAWRSGDGNWLYFVSSREGGMGGSDIYRCAWNWQIAGWGAAENLGPEINTPYDEEGVYAPGDGSTIYFASQGHASMGGYDLFKASNVKGRWSTPENLGWPINSPGDDQFLVLTADGKAGYFNSVRPGGLGEDDIYRVDFAPRQKVEETALLASIDNEVPLVEKEEQLRLIGFIKGLKMMEPVGATIEVMSLDEPRLTASFKADPATGEYSALVPAGKQYAMHVTADGYLLHSERVTQEGGSLRLDMDLKPMRSGSSEVMKNIFFALNSYTLDSASVLELRALADFLASNPALQIEVGGHTDSQVGPLPNQPLSQARAQVVVDWLVRHGIARDRLEAKGYADTEPMAPNDTPEHRARNRRTEIRVL